MTQITNRISIDLRTVNRTVAGFVWGAVLIFLGCCSVAYADGPYHGRVIDADTKQPIEAAAVLAVWWKESRIIGHSEYIHDVQEALTDKNGNFTISGTSTFSPTFRIDEPRFTIFKPGYQAYPGGLFQVSSKEIPTGLYEKDGRLIVELKRLATREERLENQGRVSIHGCDHNEKCPNLIRLKNIERSILGLGPIGPVRMLRGNIPKPEPADLTQSGVPNSKQAARQEPTPPDFIGIWTALKDALRRRDIETALNFISTKSRDRYRDIFTALGPQLSDIDQILTTIKPVAIRRYDAEFEMVRSGGSFEVLFVRDEDGTWRVASF